MRRARAGGSLSRGAMALLVMCCVLKLATGAPSQTIPANGEASETDDNDQGAGHMAGKAYNKPHLNVIEKPETHPKTEINPTTTTTTTTTTPAPVAPNEISVTIKKVQVEVVYESHCPFSRRFIYGQLWPTFKKMHDFMELTVLPFGKAKVDNVSAEHPHITCQHGSNECTGNMMETCVLHVAQETITAVKILACMSSNSQPHLAGPKCVEGTSVKWTEVQKCVDEHGTQYIVEVAKQTWSLQSYVARVPLIIMDGMKDNYVEYYAQKDFFRLVCEHVPYEEYDQTPCSSSLGRRRRRRR
uniref:Gamma-interferon inducible lysosomal thiol reductase n=1 Tax=Amblyomma triste TaxID=251400 RepID=A0A023GAD7_AMBTT